MAIKPIKGLSPQDYVPEGQDEDNKTVFRIKPLNGEQYNDVMAYLRQDENGEMTYTGRAISLCLKHGLIGWENFDIKYSIYNHQAVPPLIRTAIFAQILEVSELGGPERKN